MKKTIFIVLGVIGLLTVMLFSSFIGTYNRLQVLDESVNSSWSQVENQLQRRGDLIPNLVNTVKGYAKHEKDIFISVAESRSKLSGAIKSGNMKQISKAEGEMSGALSRLLAISENYPQLKADKVFINLQDELAGTENRVAVARKDFNENVKVINSQIRVFPTNIIAGMLGIQKREYFEAEEAKKASPNVQF
ncbi:MAG: LemA family protein [Candidatus Melainabacteria bacterium GWA2_34_9]|nr:MAG: LemA family protein [Candidatus Melainabacteria bacterium GWA2_34_9]